MKNIFSKGEILISCSSLRGLDLKMLNFDEISNSVLKINNSTLKLLCEKIISTVEQNSQKMSEMIYKRYSNGKKTDINKIILEILLARRYRGGKREDRDPELLYSKIKERTTKKLPIRLTISLYPCKIPNPLKSGGEFPDLGELISLARLKEIALSVEKIYSPGLKIIVLLDGFRFKKILHYSTKKIISYQSVLFKMLHSIDGEKYIELNDYNEVLNNNISKDELIKKNKLYMNFRKKYELIFGKMIDIKNPIEYINHLLNRSNNKEIINKFISLYMSLLYCSPIQVETKQLLKENFILKVFSDIFNFEDFDLNINNTRKKIVKKVWGDAINYIAEITSGRTIKPIEKIYPDSIRCDMHNIKSRLTLYSVDRSTKLTPFHSTGYVNDRGEISTKFRIQLVNGAYIPVYGIILGVNYQKQAFFYLSSNYSKLFENKLPKIINHLKLKK